jgi:hypothetical protein
MLPDSAIALWESTDDRLAQGLARSRSIDGDLLSFFNLSRSKDLDPLNLGELSASDCENLLEKLRRREVFFEAQLLTLMPQEAERVRRRYQALRSFLASAVKHDQPIYLID